MNQVTIKYYGVDGNGKNVTEAKRDAGNKIEKIVDNSGYAEVVRMGAFVGLIWADGIYFNTQIIWDTTKGRIYGSSYDSADKAREGLRMHMAQQTWKPEMGISHPELTDLENRDFSSWARFQLAYREAIAQGIPENQRHEWASNHAWA